jgi:hypothetical protein
MAASHGAAATRGERCDNRTGLYIVELPLTSPQLVPNSHDSDEVIQSIREALSRNIPVLVTNWFANNPPISFNEAGIRAIGGELDSRAEWHGTSLRLVRIQLTYT